MLPPCYLCLKRTGKSSSFTFSGITHSRKSGKCTDAAGVPPGIKSAGLYSFCTRKWRCFHMENPNLLPYETIVRATSGEPEAVDEVLRHYGKRIRIAVIENGHIDRDTEDSIKSRLVIALSSSVLQAAYRQEGTEFAGRHGRTYNCYQRFQNPCIRHKNNMVKNSLYTQV